MVLPDGQRYGPATPPHLADWVMEGRVLPDTVLEDAQTGQRLYASQVHGLPFGAVGGNLYPPTGSGHPSTFGGPALPYDPYAQTGPAPYAPSQQPYLPHGSPQSPVYPDYGKPPSSGLSAVSFVLSLIAAVMCFNSVGMVLAVVAVVLAIVARSRNDRTAGCAIAVSILTLGVTLLFALGRQILVGG